MDADDDFVKVDKQREQVDNGKPLRREASFSVTKILRTAQYVATPLISTFLVVHLAAPVAAALSGKGQGFDNANTLLLVGREVYRPNYVLEASLVGIPIGLHVVSGLFKRFILLRRSYKNSKRPNKVDDVKIVVSSLPTSVLSGYGLLLLPFPIHVLSTRIFPSKVSPTALNDLDYSIVSYGIHRRPLLLSLLYAGLIGGAVYHVGISGNVDKVLNFFGVKGSPTSGERREWNLQKTVWAIGGALIAVGAIRIVLEGADAARLAGLETLYKRVYEMLWL